MEGLVFAIAAIIAPFVINKFLSWYNLRSRSSRQLENASVLQPAVQRGDGALAPPEKQALTPILKFSLTCLILHTLYVAIEVYLNHPTNMFTALQIPLTTPVSALKAKIRGYSGEPYNFAAHNYF